jgi:hypothetical protein
MWGLVLSVINCVVTIALMMFLLPAGIMDGDGYIEMLKVYPLEKPKIYVRLF